MILVPAFFCLALLAGLLVEYRRTAWYRRSIPLRIAVTGTRGKTSVVRLIAAVLRDAGWRVVAKTTGSEAVTILPDGREIPIRRWGSPSIIEQKRLVKKASQLEVDCLVGEVMSIHPECHLVENRDLLAPHLTVLTNIRRDHTEQIADLKEMTAAFCLDFQPRTRVFLRPGDFSPALQRDLCKKGCRAVLCPPGISSPLLAGQIHEGYSFRENMDLVVGLCRELGINYEKIRQGIRKTRFDIGGPGIWKITRPPVFFINSFAANDPVSSRRMLTAFRNQIPGAERILVLLNLRMDRPGRTREWIRFMQRGAHRWMDRLYVTGGLSRAFKRRVPKAEILDITDPGAAIRSLDLSPKNNILIGFGNVRGAGSKIIRFFQQEGVRHGI